jgi:phage antirepressor YoqD-like protein
MKEISKEKTMTIKEVASVLGKDESTIRKIGKELFPEIFKNGITTYLNEIQVTAIKLNLGKNSELFKTKLEKSLLIQQAMQFQQEIINELQAEVEAMKPKALEYDKFLSGKDFQEVGTVAKSFDIGRNKFFEMLRKERILMENNIPYEQYKKYFKVVYKPVSINGVIDNKPVTLFNPEGISYIAKRFKLVEVK